MDFEELQLKIAQNIRDLRLQAGLTQENMGTYGFDIRHYQKIEAGRVNLTLKMIHRLALVFKIDHAKIFSS